MGSSSGAAIAVDLAMRHGALPRGVVLCEPVLLAVLTGLVGATVLAAVAGARRTNTAYDRFLEHSGAAHAELELNAGLTGAADEPLGEGGDGPTAEEVIAELRRLPFVEQLGQVAILHAAPEGYSPGGDFIAVAPMDDRLAVSIDRPKVVRGRFPTGPRDLGLNEQAAAALDKGVGDELVLRSASPEQMERLIFEGDLTVLKEPLAGPTVRGEIVGIIRSVQDLGAGALHGAYALLSREAYERQAGGASQFSPLVTVRLRGGYADIDRLQAAVEDLAGADAELSIDDRRVDVAVTDALRVQAVALLLFAAVAGAAGLVAIATATSRQAGLSAPDAAVLRALGLTRPQRVGALLGVVAPPLVAGAALSVAGAVLASPLLPLGLARDAEPDPGFSADAAVLGLGGVALAVVLAAVAGAVAWRWVRLSGADDDRRQPRAWRLPGPPVVAAGVRFALDPGGRPAAPVRQAVVGSIVAVAGVVAVLTFGASLTHLVGSPGLSGFPWDMELVGGEDVESVEPIVEEVNADPDIADALVAKIGYAEVGGRPTQVYGTRVAKGDTGMTILSGRAPATDDEAALGPRTAQALGADIGDTVRVAFEDGSEAEYRMVGTALFPTIDNADYTRGLHLTEEGYRAEAGFYDVLINVADGVDPAAKRAALEEEIGFLYETEIPAEIANLRQAQNFPIALAAFLALLGVAVLVHALVAGVRRRRRDLAVLRTLGFVRRQTAATVAVHALTVVGVAIVVGVPLGLAGGRWAWTLLADGFDVVARPVVPWTVAIVVPAALAVAIAVASWPARRAATVSPAAVLRAE